MNTTTALKKTSEHGGPIVLSAGAALFAVALFASHGPAEVAAVPPRPAVTATVTAPAPEPARMTAVARPSTTPTSATVVPVSDATAAMPHTEDGSLSHAQARPPSAPQPSPAAAPCSGQGLSVRLLKAACVKIGGGS